MPKTLLYYTDFNLPDVLFAVARNNLIRVADDADIITVGINKPAGFGREQIVLYGERSILMMHNQILAGLRAARPGPVFMCEHDVIYSREHFAFIPLRGDTFYYNVNVVHARWPDGHTVAWDECQQVSGLCADRDLLIEFYEAKLNLLGREGKTRHYEPGLRQQVGGQRVENWRAARPNIDVRHGLNLTASKWSPADFRNPRYAAGWRELGKAPGWNELFEGVNLWH